MFRILKQIRSRGDSLYHMHSQTLLPIKYFSSSPQRVTAYNKSIKSELLHDQSQQKTIQGVFDEGALEIGREKSSSKKEESINFFDKGVYLKGYAHTEFDEWRDFYKIYIKSITDRNPSLLYKKAEKNLIVRVENFLKKLDDAKLRIRLLEPSDVVYNVNLFSSSVIKDVYIDREFMRLQSKAQKDEKGPLFNNINPTLYDSDVQTFEALKKHSKYSVNQYYISVETNARIVITENDDSKIIYGVKEPAWETHVMIIENRRNYFKKYPYFLVDFDYVLNKNVHTFN